MKTVPVSRRKAISTMALAGLASSLPLFASPRSKSAESDSEGEASFRFCLNTSTISGQKSGLLKYIEIASGAGYDGIEVWVRDVQDYLAEGGSTKSLRAFIEDHNIRVENAIGFAPWLAAGEAGFRQMEEEMNMLAEIGCSRIAAPPAGVPGDHPLDLFMAGEKYGQLLSVGRKTGVMPQLEFWGASGVLWHMGQVLMIVAVANDPDARILPDVYHMFRGGSGFNSLKMLDGSLIDIFHMNDYPASIPMELQTDADRVYPGDGCAPLDQIIPDLKRMGGGKVLSLELFNPSYWEKDPLLVASAGLQKMKAAIR